MATTGEIRRVLSMISRGRMAFARAQERMPLQGQNIAEADVEPPRLLSDVTPEYARRVKERCSDWFRAKGVQGIGISRRRTCGKQQKETALKVYVDRKLPASRCRHKVPKSLQIRGIDERIPTDVEEIGTVQLQLNTNRLRPAEGGCSVFYSGIDGAGTLGCLVRKRGTDGPLYILSNSHVIANDSQGPINHPIVQPGESDAGDSRDANLIAELFQWVIFQPRNSLLLNTCDAAIAKVKNIGPQKAATSIIFGLGKPPGKIETTIRRGMMVKISGRTSTLESNGKVEDVDFTTKPLDYVTGKYVFHHQVLCSRFTALGDSGALVLDERNRAVGLHFAGSESHSIFNRLGYVLNTFDIEVVTELLR